MAIDPATAALIAKGAAGIFQQIQGGKKAEAGTLFQIEQFELGAAATRAETGYNKRLSQLNLNRQLDSLSRQITRFTSSQTVSAASSGISLGSKSFLAAQNETLSAFEKNIVQLRNTGLQQQESIRFRGESKEAEFLAKANAARFAGASGQAFAQGQLVKSGLELGTTLLGGLSNNKPSAGVFSQ